jgi:RimJ/RimL family protein N-acetyltransferase
VSICRFVYLLISVSRAEDRGLGYGADAARTLVRYSFEHLDLRRVTAAIVEYNITAQHALEKVGFVQEGRERQAIFCAGQRWDRLIYGLLWDDFEGEIGLVHRRR